MAKITLHIKDENLKNIDLFQSLNNITTRTEAINFILESYLNNRTSLKEFEELIKKVERLLKMTNLIKDLSEQSFANNGFRINKNVKEDEKLQEFYRDIQKNKYNFFD